MRSPRATIAPVLAVAIALASTVALSGPLRDRIMQRQAERTAGEMTGTRVLRDVAYGADPAQRFDVYLPPKPSGPVIFMVHGGAWKFGDKASADVVVNKAKHWLARGFVFVSVNNRLLPKANPLQQAEDVAAALAAAQKQAASWGAEPSRFVILGHSAGGHLVALLGANPSFAAQRGARPWRGTVSLDSGALDVEATMQARHARLHDEAFGSDPAFWRAVSPLANLAAGAPPLLAVCSSKRAAPCPEAESFKRRAEALADRVDVMPRDLTHHDINALLGTPGDYTESVDRWISSIL
ncbi:MAG TPA: alpha/beta hydrolase [Ramlibacter sp.]|uniref:alpha/beta hydrolase n=1 Tax=Ramlibacter sp. TaxID=1917967 RepID=UPI002B63B7F3|nr:alpha/beta hydrolase [Ramlibacter sp.]HVZ46652.1 alpha/beta hydrolase [Ramlibacter sp.]